MRLGLVWGCGPEACCGVDWGMAQFEIRAFAAAMIATVLVLPTFGQASGGAPAPAATAKVLAEGDAAPSLDGLTWLKRDEVQKFESGRIYIVEMWATWCGPCKRGIPHLTELQAKHKEKLTVIGISCWERADTAEARVAHARSFVDSQGAEMEYTVAADGDGAIVRNWMVPAGRRSIPTAFIVDGQGRIAWIGNPLSGMDAVLEKVLAGGFDAKAEAARARVAAAEKQAKDELFARANLLAQQGKHQEGLVLMDQVLALETDSATRVAMIRQKLRMLLNVDEAKGYAFTRATMDGEFKESDLGLHSLASAILMMPGLSAPDHALVVTLSEKAVQLASPTNAAVHETLGQAKFRAGDVPGAIAAAERSLEVMRGPESRGSAAAVSRVQRQLEEYRAAATGPQPDTK